MPNRPSTKAAILVLIVAGLLTVILGLGTVHAAEVASAERTLDADELRPGESTNVTLEIDLESADNITIAEVFDPAFADVQLVDADGADFAGVNDANTELFATWGGVESVTLVYTVTVPQDAAAGDTFEITSPPASEADFGTDAITVYEAPAPRLEVRDPEPAEITVSEGETFDVSATIENTGTAGGADTVELVVDGTTLASRERTLQGGEVDTVGFTDVATDDLDPGEYTYTIRTSENEVSGTLTVEATDQGEPIPGLGLITAAITLTLLGYGLLYYHRAHACD